MTIYIKNLKVIMTYSVYVKRNQGVGHCGMLVGTCITGC